MKGIRRLRSVVLAAFGVSVGALVFASAPSVAALPVVDGEQVLGVGSVSATVQAQVNPGLQPVGYHFEYGTGSSYGMTAPAPDSNLAVGEADENATWTLSGLRPGTSYHFRVVVTGASGSVYGEDRTFTTYSGTTASGSCVNAAVREAQFSSFLSDCRAWEMVSPVEKNGINIGNSPSLQESAADGNAVQYMANSDFGGSYGSETPGGQYVSQREADGWSFHPINPVQRGGVGALFLGPIYEAFSEDLTKGVFYAMSPVDSGHPNVEQVANLYLRRDVLSSSVGSYELLTDSVGLLPPRPRITSGIGVAFAAASADFSHILFETASPLTPEAEGLPVNLPKLYEWDEGIERLVGILPDGSPAEGSIAGQGMGGGSLAQANTMDHRFSYALHSMSRDGSRVVFVGPPFLELSYSGSPNLNTPSPHFGGNVYMRIDHSRTVQLNVSERSQQEPGEARAAIYWGSTPDDSRVFFVTEQNLVDGATGTGAKFYMYDVNAPAGKHLTLISSACNLPRDGSNNFYTDQFGVPVDGISEDGEYVYIVSECALRHGDNLNGNEGLYVWHDGTLRLIAEHQVGYGLGEGPGEEDPNWGTSLEGTTIPTGFRMTPDGRHVALVSRAQFTAERAGVSTDNTKQVYVYNYDEDRLTCASCARTGLANKGNSAFATYLLGVVDVKTQYLSRQISADGRYVFFDTSDPLVLQDTNGKRDVYEYDTVSGDVSLISGGTCNCESLFVDASSDGSNVFFTTVQRLVAIDIDGSSDLYDARVNGGLPAQNQVSAPLCNGDACQLAAESAPDLSASASSTFSGVGNVVIGSEHAASVVPKHKSKKSKRRSKRRHGKAARGHHSSKRASVRRAGR